MKQRIEYMDLVKFFAIYLVIWGHFVLIFNNTSYLSYKIIYSFHMPLFMMVSGFFSESTWKKGFMSVIKSKAQHLLIPVILCTALEAIINYLLCSDFNYQQLRDIVIGNSWFLKTLFVIYIASYYVRRYVSNDYLALFLIFIVSCSIPHAYTLQINKMIFYFWLGIIINHNIKTVEKYRFLILPLCSIWFVSFHLFFYKPASTIYSLQYLLLNLNDFCVQCLSAICGGGIILILSKLIYEKLSNTGVIKCFCEWGKYTLEVYVIQTIIVCSLMKCLLKLDVDPFVQNILSFVTSFVIVWICVYIAKFICKNKKAAFICFGKKI